MIVVLAELGAWVTFERDRERGVRNPVIAGHCRYEQSFTTTLVPPHVLILPEGDAWIGRQDRVGSLAPAPLYPA